MDIIIYAISVLLLTTAFISNEIVKIYVPLLLSLLCFAYILIIIFHPKYQKLRFTKTNISLALFVLLNVVLIFDSIYITSSVREVVFYIQCFLLFICMQQLATEKYLLFISKAFVILSSLFALFSFTHFIEIGLLSNSKLDGIVGPSGVYAGFLVLPLFLAVYLIMHSQGLQKRLWYVCTAVLLASLALTFSVSSWIITIIAQIIVTITFWQNIKAFVNKDKIQKFIKPKIWVLLLAFIVFCSVWYLARQTMLARDSEAVARATLYEQQNQSQSFIKTRYNNYVDASQLFFRSPVTGFGAGQYADAVQLHKDGVVIDDLDPHNWFLRSLVENGIIITLILASFFLFYFGEITQRIYNKKIENFLELTVFVGLLGGFIHNYFHSGWGNKPVVLIWIIFAGLLYGYSSRSNPSRISMKWFNYTLFVLAILVTIVSIQFVRADTVRLKGDYYFVNKNYDFALSNYFHSATYSSHDPFIWYKLWQVYFAMNRFELAKDNINKALDIYPLNKVYKSALTKTLQMLDGGVDYPHNTP